MSLQLFQKEDWIKRLYRKSESVRTERVAKASLKMFDYFCKHEGTTEEKMIQQYQELTKEDNVESVCLLLDRFIEFLNEDHDDILIKSIANPKDKPLTLKKKNPNTIKIYFGFVKSYLRVCHRIKIPNEDVKDFMRFPKAIKEPRRAISLETIKNIFAYSGRKRKAFYYLLISSGMRVSEGLALKKQDFHLNENPVRITLPAKITKTNEGRDSYISSEGFEKLKPFLEEKEDNEIIFSNGNIDRAVTIEEQAIGYIRKKLNLTEKYPDSPRYLVNIHCFRAYFHTKASQKHGSDYANALDGHGAYLKQYYRETPEERARKYKELEPSLFIESFKLETEKTKDNIIKNLQEEMKRLQDKMTCLESMNTA